MFLTTEQLAEELGWEVASVSHLARNNKLPASKIGKHWVFIREDVENALRSTYDERVRVGLQNESLGESTCESTQETENSATTSQPKSPQQDDEYKNLLGLVQKPKH